MANQEPESDRQNADTPAEIDQPSDDIVKEQLIVEADEVDNNPTIGFSPVEIGEMPVVDNGHSIMLGDIESLFVDLRADLKDDLSGFASSIDNRLSANERREQIIDALHKELQEHRRGIHLLLLKPVFNDLIRLHDQLAAASRHVDETTASRFTNFALDVEEILARNDVELFESTSDEIDRRRQQVMGTETTNNTEHDGRIARRLSKGFSYRDEMIIRHEQVVIWKYDPVSDTATEPQTPVSMDDSPEEN